MRLGVLTLDIDNTRPATREETAQYAFNALTIRYVNWDVNRGNYQLQSDGRNVLERVHAGLPSQLARTTTFDSFGRPQTRWTLRGEQIGVYAIAPTFTFTSSRTAAEVTAARGAHGYPTATTDPATVTSILNGENISNSHQFSTDALLSAATGNGVLVQVYSNVDRVIYRVVVTRTDVYHVSAINTGARTVTLTRMDGSNAIRTDAASPAPNNSFLAPSTFTVGETGGLSAFYGAVSNLAVGARVLLTPRWTPGAGTDPAAFTIGEITQPTAVTGVISVATGAALTVGGTEYSRAAVQTTAARETGAATGDTTILLDTHGFVVDTSRAAAPARNYLIVTRSFFNISASGELLPMATGYLTDGTEITVQMLGSALAHQLGSGASVPGLFRVTETTAAGVRLQPLPGTLTPQDMMTATAMPMPFTGAILPSQVRLPFTIPGDALATNITIAREIRFFYLYDGAITIVEGMHENTLPADSWALIEARAGAWVVTGMFVPAQAPLAVDTARVLYVASTPTSVNSVLIGDPPTRVNIAPAYVNGELIMTSGMRGAPIRQDVVPGFYHFTVQADGSYTARPFAPGTGVTRVIVGAPVTAANRAGSFITLGNVDVVINASTIITDVRRDAMAPPVPTAAVDTTAAGFISAAADATSTQAPLQGPFSGISVSVMYNSETNVASLVYITSTTGR
jgi:hypothetical protein